MRPEVSHYVVNMNQTVPVCVYDTGTTKRQAEGGARRETYIVYIFGCRYICTELETNVFACRGASCRMAAHRSVACSRSDTLDITPTSHPREVARNTQIVILLTRTITAVVGANEIGHKRRPQPCRWDGRSPILSKTRWAKAKRLSGRVSRMWRRNSS